MAVFCMAAAGFPATPPHTRIVLGVTPADDIVGTINRVLQGRLNPAALVGFRQSPPARAARLAGRAFGLPPLKFILTTIPASMAAERTAYPDAFRRMVRRFTQESPKAGYSSGMSSIRRRPMPKLALFIFLGAAAAPSLHVRDTKDVRRHVSDVCNQFVINDPGRPPRVDFSRDCIVYDPDMKTPEWNWR